MIVDWITDEQEAMIEELFRLFPDAVPIGNPEIKINEDGQRMASFTFECYPEVTEV